MKFADINRKGKKIKDSNGNQTYLKMYLASAYFPVMKHANDLNKDEAQPHGKFVKDEMEAILVAAPCGAHIIMGGDIDGRIGICGDIYLLVGQE